MLIYLALNNFYIYFDTILPNPMFDIPCSIFDIPYSANLLLFLPYKK